VKRGILLGFRVGGVIDMSIRSSNDDVALSFFDKDTYPPRSMSLADGVRIVPGGSSIRRGAYVANGVVCMPPRYINVGAHIGSGTMIDSHALVGSCAQVGERVHLSAAAQLGGVLEPVNASPVVVEDDVVVGGNCGIYEGTVVRRRAVIGAGVVLTRGTPVYDLERQTVHRAENGKPLVIPENAVVVPGARAVKGDWGQVQGISLQTPVIVKYRDEKTDAATALESWLR
jgi:2,3,4,5-tetrahydropyridine-2-carboxylate N-succinyltransferase